MFIQRKSGIILSADVETIGELDALLQIGATSEAVVAIKVGFTLALRFGLTAIAEHIRSISRIPIIYDHQKAGTDIPEMGGAFAKTCKDSGADAVIFFPQAGPETLQAFVAAAFNEQLTPIVGLVMTHPRYLASDGGFIVDDAPTRIYDASIDLDVKNFVLPGTKPNVIEQFASRLQQDAPDAVIMMPGIGSQGGSLRAAFAAAEPIARFAIVGSAIYRAINPRAAFIAFLEDMER